MTIIEIVMIIIGLAAIIISFRVADSNSDKKENIPEVDTQKQLLEQIDKAVEEKTRELMNSTDDELSKISNDKIMGLSEYSEQIFEKIEKNHEETVFLYNMLNEKEREIKDLIQSADTTRADIRDAAAKMYQDVKGQLDEVDDARRKLEVENVKGTISDEYTDESQKETADTMKEQQEQSPSVYDAEIARIELAENDDVVEQRTDNAEIAYDKHTDKEHNSNAEIISLYRKGRTVLEISKMLSIGQGEVKFVIDLYNAR